jgi:hypothetical protein
MTDPNSSRDSADKAYGFWNSTGAWVAAHPKMSIVTAPVVIGLAVFAWIAH